MNRFLLISLLCLLGTQAGAQYNEDNLKLATEEASVDFTHDKLRIYPITANRVFLETHATVGNFMPLKDALESEAVVIHERSNVDASGITGGTPAEYGDELGGTVEVIAEVEEIAPNVTLETVEGDADAAEIEVDEDNFDGHIAQHQELSRELEPVQQQAVINEDAIQLRGGYANNDNVQIRGGRSAGDEVNRLFIENTSQDTVFIMAGEVVKGGKQDRVIAQDMIIPPNSGAIDLSVFCVEKGRWHYGESDGKSFAAYGNVASNSVRSAAVVNKVQSEVWSKVDDVTMANDAGSSTQAYTALEDNKAYKKELQHYLDKFADLPKVSPNTIGVVVTTGDRVIGCDMFATPDLFRRAYPNLLHGYATEAMSSGETVSISDAQVQKYLSKILRDEAKQDETVSKNGQLLKHKKRTLHMSTF